MTYAVCNDSYCPEECTACEPGYACRGGRRYLCGVGTASNGTQGKNIFLFLLIHNMTFLYENLSGKYSFILEFCKLCSPGTYQNETGQPMCNNCPNGYYSSKMMDRCEPCPPLTYSNDGRKSVKITCLPKLHEFNRILLK